MKHQGFAIALIVLALISGTIIGCTSGCDANWYKPGTLTDVRDPLSPRRPAQLSEAARIGRSRLVARSFSPQVVMAKTVLDVGNCGPDHAAIRSLLTQQFGARVLRADGPSDTLKTLESERVDLVLVNRKLDQDYSDGIEVLKLIRERTEFAGLPVMLITNHEEHQQQAVDMGAVWGFGKLALGAAETRKRLAEVLEPS